MFKIYYDEELNKVFYQGLIDGGVRGEMVASAVDGKVTIFNNKLNSFFIRGVPHTLFLDGGDSAFTDLNTCIDYLNEQLSLPNNTTGTRDEQGNIISNITTVTGVVITDADGQFFLDLTNFNFTEIIEATAVIVDQVFDSLTDITQLLDAVITNISPSQVAGVTRQGTTQAVNVLGDTVDSVQRGGAGNQVRMVVRGRQ